VYGQAGVSVNPESVDGGLIAVRSTALSSGLLTLIAAGPVPPNGIVAGLSPYVNDTVPSDPTFALPGPSADWSTTASATAAVAPPCGALASGRRSRCAQPTYPLAPASRRHHQGDEPRGCRRGDAKAGDPDFPGRRVIVQEGNGLDRVGP
jgi:hypothetical protein